MKIINKTRVQEQQLVEDTEELLNVRRPKNWFDALRSRFSVQEKAKYLDSVNDAAKSYSNLQDSLNEITNDNLANRLEKRTNEIQAGLRFSESNLNDANAHLAQSEQRATLESERLDAEIEKQRAQKEDIKEKREARTADLETYKQKLREEMLRKRAKNEIADEEFFSDIEERNKIITRLDQMCRDEINQYIHDVEATGRAIDKSPGSEDFRVIQAIETRYEKDKQTRIS